MSESGDPRLPPNCDLTLGMRCIDKSQPGVTVWQMAAEEHLANPVGVIQGGFLAAFADSAMATATVTNFRAGGPTRPTPSSRSATCGAHPWALR